jgi:indolepyruvate ferredoxin oxidoreductase
MDATPLRDAAQLTGSLDDRFTESARPVLLNGMQALVRLLLEQARDDVAQGFNTGGFVSGYRGSPLAKLDHELWLQRALLDQHRIVFRPGVNEDLAATMVWGTQQLQSFPGARVDGVFGMWYGKGPGVDRSVDALRHANIIGTMEKGGVLAVAGDDHAAQSSTFAHQSDFAFQSACLPVLHPAGIDDYIPLGLAGYAMSRFAGLWVGFKAVSETAESGGTVTLAQPHFRRPDMALPPHGLNVDPRLPWPAKRTEYERRLIDERVPAALAWARANRLDRLVFGRPDARLGIVTVGKAHHDVVRALAVLGLSPEAAAAAGVAVYRIALAWPLETEGLAAFAQGKQALLLVEEKRAFVEPQARAALYNLPADRRPAFAGKTDEAGAPLIPSSVEISPETMLPVLARWLGAHGLEVSAPAARAIAPQAGLLARTAFFCAGCPHNSSTRVPEGHHAAAGIGCHIMALGTEPTTQTFTHMGAEGVTWAGQAPFSDTPHLFVNIGDGTWQHSGVLAFRQSRAASSNITYKILVNDAVAMTGGQPIEGRLPPAQIARQCAAEGAARIAVVADLAENLPQAAELPPGTTLHTREALDQVQRDLAATPGTTALIYVQVCATEKRRRRKRGRMADAEVAVQINPRVCEGCGDCSAQSHCIAIEPLETPFGRKRRISPTACNTDMSCLKGFCPSFVTSSGERPKPASDPRWARLEAEIAPRLPMPQPALPDGPYRMLFGGIGGGGIVTSGAIVAMAAHLDGLAVRTLDFTGLAQKNGAVVSHVQVARQASAFDVARVPEAGASLMVAADLAVGATADMLRRCAPDAAVIGNLDLQATAAFVFDHDLKIDAGLHRRHIEAVTDPARSHYLHAAALAETLFGTAQALNTVLLGIAWQRGLLPVSLAALERAIGLNGTAVTLNLRALLWGRMLAEQPGLAATVLGGAEPEEPLAALVDRLAGELVLYQNERLARRYRNALAPLLTAPPQLARQAATTLFKLMAYKDEYEVARLHLATFGAEPDPGRLTFHLAPPLISGTDKATGKRRKMAVPGRVALPLFRLLAPLKRLRGTLLDPFHWQHDRRMERRMLRDYLDDLALIGRHAQAWSLDSTLALAQIPDRVRGFGPVKQAALHQAWGERDGLRRALTDQPQPAALAAE